MNKCPDNPVSGESLVPPIIQCAYLRKALGLMLTLAALAVVGLSVAGCKPTAAEDASKSDANGFLCPACGEKFYTSVKVYPSYCPQCKKPDIIEIVGYFCEDGQVLLGPRDQKVKDPKTGKLLTTVKLPRESELLAWGAKKRTAQEVGSTQ
jgi:hypothetical protein